MTLTFLYVLFPHTVSAQLTPGVLQSAAQTATITGTVVQSDGTPVVDADVRLNGAGAQLTTKSDTHGTFSFISVPYGTYRIDAMAPNLGMASRENIVVKGDITVAIQYVMQSGTRGLKEIARVSTHSSGVQINVTPANIASINPSEYAFQGNTSWKELLNQIPGVTVGGYLSGGASSNDVVPGAPLDPITISINGALPYETSVMLDGMPLVNTSNSVNGKPGNGADLSYLPMPMFDTADVVRGPGANAPSIVDSIGGSFVLHAPGRVEKNQLEFSVANDAYGGTIANAKAGVRYGRLSAVFVYGTYTSPGPLGNQNVISANVGKPVTVNGQPFLACTAPSSCNGYPPNVNAAYRNCYCEFVNSLLYCCTPISTAWTQHSGAAALSYDITPSVTAQIFYAGSSASAPQSRWIYPVDFTPGPSYAGSISPGMYRFNSTFVNTGSIQASSLMEEKITAYLKRGVLRLAALQDNSFEQYLQPTSAQPNGQYLVYGTGYLGTTPPGIPVTYNGSLETLTFAPSSFSLTNRVNNRDLLASYATQLGAASTLGISYVTSYYNDPEIAYYNGSLYITRPSSVSETTRELRINVDTAVSDRLSLNASWYFARGSYHVQNPNDLTHNTFLDSAFPYSAPRFGAVWRANQNTAIRVAMGGGYALPPLTNLSSSNAIYLCGPYYEAFLTNLNLKPEESFGFDVGTDIRLHRDTVLSFDLYRTNLYGQFFQSTSLTGTYNGLPLYTNESGNLTQSRYEGINIDIRHDVSKGFYWHGALGLTRAYVISTPAGFYDDPTVPCTNCANTYIVPGINFDGQFQSTVPYANGSAQLGYRWAPERYVDLSPTYYGNGNAYFEPAFLEFDAHVGYGLTKNISLLATFRNITGIYGQNYETLTPSIGAPAIAGQPFALFGLPIGPRSLTVTANLKY